jgi:hypothetical protein
MLLALFTDADNREIARKDVDMKAGESRGDIQFVLGLFGEYTDFPEDYEHLADEELVRVPHPHRVGESVESFGVVRLMRLR